MNGYNIRGMNGIIRANILGAQEVSYEILYSNANSGGIWINLYKYYSSTWENNTELIDQVSPSVYDSNDFQWRDDVQTNGSVDINKIYQKIAPYFYDAPILKAGVEGFVTGSLDASDSSHLIYPNRPLYQWIYNYPEEFLRNYFDGLLFKDWLAGNNLSDLNFDFIGNLVWASDGSLYGLYDPYWWGFSESGTKVVKLLGANGFRDLQVVNLANGDKKPSMIKIIGDYLYYRYAILDYTNQETGLHKVSRYNILSGFHEELFPSDLSGTIEVMSYDVASDNSVLYFAGANPQTNQVYNGRIDLNTGNWELLQSTIRFSNVRVIE